MPYRQDLSNSARRHLRAADTLQEVNTAGAQPGCKAVAGYLFGLCGELATKAMMSDSGMTPLAAADRRHDPFYAHFPTLKILLKNTASGRRAVQLRRIAETAALFQNWDTNMRYAPTSDVQDAWVAAWSASARDLISQMDSL